MNEPTVMQPPSSSVGDYVKAIWEVAGIGAASTSDVADQLSIAPASVTNMFGRLREMGLVEYERYRGASLTEAGRVEALRLVRRHRLIETFLVGHLGYSWEEVHEEAEHLEHVVSDGFTERLAGFLGHPVRDPHGDPIPAADGTVELDDSHPLDAAKPGEQVRISQINNRDTPVLAYLGEHGLVPGRLLEVKEVRDLDDVVTVDDEDGTPHSLGKLLAGSILVRSNPEGGK
jgi:DtxR family transcriptional regulator, Mn-dependent transcriptional regulator